MAVDFTCQKCGLIHNEGRCPAEMPARIAEQDKLIARLEGVLKGTGLRNADLQAALELARADGAAVRGALEPFAKAAESSIDEFDGPDSNDTWEHSVGMEVTIGDYRHARQALADHPGEGMLEDCDHDWVDTRNKIIQDGEWCPKCNAIRAGNEATGAALKEQPNDG